MEQQLNVINYKNDLYDRAKSFMVSSNKPNSSILVNSIIDEIKFKTYLSTVLNTEINDELLYIDKDYSIETKEEGYDLYTVQQLRVNDSLFITWSSCDLEVDEQFISYISLMQFDYINTTHNKSTVNNIIDTIKDFLYVETETNNFFIIGSNSNGLTLKKEKIEPIDVDIELNYGKDFVKFHDNVIHSLTNKTHGLVLMSGLPGTGKSSFLKYLINKLSLEKDIIYVPSFLMNEMANPEFITFIRDQKNSILILEDAEEILIDREDGHNSQAVSNLLNMTNGLLNDSLKIQIVATFNIDKKKIDKALLRTGRLIDEWQFGALKPEDANKLAIKLGKTTDYKKSIVLADIYDDCLNDNQPIKKSTPKKIAKKRVGFNDTEDEL